MYRNTYLELYKNTASQQKNLTLLLNHFGQIYNTLGYVLQDLQYQIGRVQFQNSILEGKEQRQPENQHQNHQKKKKGSQSQRNIVKVEESCPQDPYKNNRNLQPTNNPIRNNQKKCQFIHELIKSEHLSPKTSTNKPSNYNDKLPHQKQLQRMNQQQIGERVRGEVQVNRQSDSFDQLFDFRKQQKMSLERNKQKQSKLAQIQQNQQESEHSLVHNTYDDFLERIFKEPENRKSR